MTSSPEIPCNRFTYERGAYLPLSKQMDWEFWDHANGCKAVLRFRMKDRTYQSHVWGTLGDPMVTDTLVKLLPPEEVAKATAIAITGREVT